MSEEDKKILNNFINKKEEVLEFKEIKTIVKLLIEVDKKINELLPARLEIKMLERKKIDDIDKHIPKIDLKRRVKK